MKKFLPFDSKPRHDVNSLNIILTTINSLIINSKSNNVQYITFLSSASSICNNLLKRVQIDSSFVQPVDFYTEVQNLRSSILNAQNALKNYIVQQKSETMDLENSIQSSFSLINKNLIDLDLPNIIYGPDQEVQLIKSHESINQNNRSVSNYKICYFVFITKLKQLFQYTEHSHKQRLFVWMHLYSQKIHPQQRVNINTLKNFHRKIHRQYQSIESIINQVKNILGTQFEVFNRYINQFDQVFPETKAVLQFFSLNNLQKDYKKNCQVAKEFFATSVKTKTQSAEEVKRYEWTRYQYLTYVAFVSIQQDKIMLMRKNQFYDFVDYSFDGDIQKLWQKHSVFKRYQHWRQLYKFLTEQWVFTKEVIQFQKYNIAKFIKQKEFEKQKIILSFKTQPSTFQKFIAEKQTFDLNSKLCILTDEFQFVSKRFKCCIFDCSREKEQKESKTKKSKKYSVFLIAQFQIKQMQKQYLKKQRQQLLKLQMQFQQLDLNSQNQKQKKEESNFEQSLDQQNQIDIRKKQNHDGQGGIQQQCHDLLLHSFSRHSFHQIKQNNNQRPKQQRNQTQIDKQFFENNLQILFFKQKSQCRKFKQEIKDYSYFQELTNTEEDKQSNKSLVALQKQKLIKDRQQMNASLQSTEFSFTWNQQTNCKNQLNLPHSIELKKQTANEQLKIIEEEISFRSSQSEPQQQNVNSINRIQHFEYLKSNIQAKDIEQLEQYIRSLVSQKQVSLINSLFRRKIFELRFMSQFNDKKQKFINQIQVKKTVWKFQQEIKYVAFLIVNRFALLKLSYTPDFTFSVMSEFIKSKNPRQCLQHYKNYKIKDNVNEIIYFLIKKLNIPSQSIEKQVNLLKQSYYQSKGNIFVMKKRNKISKLRKKKDIHKKYEESIISRLEEKPLIFNLKKDYLFSKDQEELQYQQITKSIRLVQKERYLKCLEFYSQNYEEEFHTKKLMNFASQIFKERDLENQTQLLYKYHKIMLRKHGNLQKIRKYLKNQQKGILIRKNKTEIQRKYSLQFLTNFCERVFFCTNTLEFQILQEFIQLKESK